MSSCGCHPLAALPVMSWQVSSSLVWSYARQEPRLSSQNNSFLSRSFRERLAAPDIALAVITSTSVESSPCTPVVVGARQKWGEDNNFKFATPSTSTCHRVSNQQPSSLSSSKRSSPSLFILSVAHQAPVMTVPISPVVT